MLTLPLKSVVRFDIQSALAAWLDDDDAQVHFEPRNPLEFVLPKPAFRSAACRRELQRLAGLRNCLADALLKPSAHPSALDDNALEDAMEYHAVLLEFEKRGFPVHEDPMAVTSASAWSSSSTGTRLAMTWKSAWSPQQETHATLVWDRACILFNLAALYSYKATVQCSLNDRAQCKQAVQYYQSAASMLHILQELVPSQSPPYQTVDLSLPCLSFWRNYFLAAAQNAIYRMASIPDNSNPNAAPPNHSTLAMLAQSAHVLYNQALEVATKDARLASELPRPTTETWAPYCKAMSMMAAAKAEYHQAVTHRLSHQQECGLEIARLQRCLKKLEACREFCKSQDDPDGSLTSTIRREVLLILPVVKDRYNEVVEDNYKIYQDDVPADSSKLPDITAKQLAKVSSQLPSAMLVPKLPLFEHLN